MPRDGGGTENIQKSANDGAARAESSGLELCRVVTEEAYGQQELKDELGDTKLIYVGGVQSGDNCQTIMDEGFELFQLAHVLIKDPDFVKHVQANLHYHAGCGRSNYCVGRMYTKDMKCHECVERDGEQIPARLKKEIAKLEAKAKKSIG